MANQKLSDFVKAIAKKTGFDVEGEEFKNVLEAIKEVDIPENIVNHISENLITIDEAKTNAKLNTFFKGRYLGTVDGKLIASLKDIGVSEDDIIGVQNTEDTLEKIKKSMSLIKGMIKKPADNTDLQAHLDKIESLEKELNTVKEKSNLDLSEKDKQMTGIRLESKLESMLGIYTFQDAYKKEDLLPVLKQMVLNGKALLKSENGTINLYSKEVAGDKYRVDNKDVETQDYLDGIVQPYLKKSDSDNKPTLPIPPTTPVKSDVIMTPERTEAQEKAALAKKAKDDREGRK